MSHKYISPQNRLYRFLSDNGDGTGNIDAIGDYSATPYRLFCEPPAGQIFQLNRILITVKDTGSFDSGGYGNGIALPVGLKAGLAVGLPDGSLREDFLEGPPIKTNGDYHIWAGVDVAISSFGQGDEYLSVRWTFSKGGGIDGEPIFLDGDKGEKLFIEFNDDFTGLNQHLFQVQGILQFKG